MLPFDRNQLREKRVLIVGAGYAAANILAYINRSNEHPILDFLLIGNDRVGLEKNTLPKDANYI